MPQRARGFSIRTWFAVIVLVALLLQAAIHANERPLRFERERFHRVRQYYFEGRVPVDRCLARSKALMELELRYCWTRAARRAAIKAHLERINDVVREERRLAKAPCLHCFNAADLWEAENYEEDAKLAVVREADPESSR